MSQSTARNVASHQPVFSQNTVTAMQQAINSYTQIVMAGGWPMVPDQAKLQLGVQHSAVPILRERLVIAGDLPRAAGNGSPVFDTSTSA
ncbi:hypothetical protein [Aurantimonas coralicida]|uniref:hypothetical protein n=1 Tax=Aurantimonas coralicida TaxID=182270 RepID=UPI000406E1E4|nr:hypothetical protein [Aurantimonas coralicida]